MINKTVAGGIDVLTSPGESFLRQIGAAFFTGLTGNLCLNSMAQDLATFPGENTGAASANMAPAALTLAARRLTHTQSISKETLAQTNPAIYASILQNLQDGMWNAIVKDYFTTIESDGVTDIGIATGSTFTYADALNLEAAIGMLNIGPACYVTTPAIRAQMKKIAALTNQAAVWLNNTVNGYPAYCTPGQKATYITFGDFSKAAVAQWGGFEVIIDPFTDAKKGLINLTIVGLVDTGCFNTRGLANVAIA
jgi:HK97 family phage major capsid protein